MYVRLMDAIHRVPFAKPRTDSPEMTYAIELSQPFKPSETLESKKHNLREAATCINRLTIRPGEVFSFWHTVGSPNNPKRFAAGRTIHHGVVKLDLGGGLCQASGIIHHAAVLAGMQITERHNHSVDLYTEETRFAPLGTDATVFYGFKDFRFVNTTQAPIRIELLIREEEIVVRLLSTTPIEQRELATRIEKIDEKKKRVILTDAADGSFINESIYEECQH